MGPRSARPLRGRVHQRLGPRGKSDGPTVPLAAHLVRDSPPLRVPEPRLSERSVHCFLFIFPSLISCIRGHHHSAAIESGVEMSVRDENIQHISCPQNAPMPLSICLAWELAGLYFEGTIYSVHFTPGCTLGESMGPD